MQENDLFIWEKLRDELRLLRGQSLFRGREDHDAEKAVITLERERRKSGDQRGFITIQFGSATSGIFAELFPEKRKILLSDFGDDLRLFLKEVLALARGGDYLHTNSEKATYREDIKN